MIVVYLSVTINILVAGFWGVVLAFFPSWRPRVWPYGEDSPGTRVLSSIYLAITAFSIYALAAPNGIKEICPSLFAFQIAYKTLSAFTVRDLRNPVVVANLLIVIPHSLSLYWLYNKTQI